MDFIDWIYLMLGGMQILMILRVRLEGAACNWTRQARWISRRMTWVTLAVFGLTMTDWFWLESGDALMDGLLMVSLVAMTVLIACNLPSILSGMTDERVGEDLNIRMNEPEHNLGG